MAYTTINKSTDHFNTKLFTGNGGTNAITGVGFQPDWTWIKNRSRVENHVLYDAVRGVTKRIKSNTTEVEDTKSNGLTAFGTDGFTMGSAGQSNYNGDNIASWNWKANGAGSANTDGSINSTVSANTTAGFSIVKYTGNGSNNTSVGHGLGVAPKIIFFKNLSGANNWRVQYSFVDGSRDRLQLDTTVAKYDSSSVTANSNSLFYLDTGGEQNGSGSNYIAYCFAEKQGYSKIGSYVGNGNANGTFCFTGMKPSFVITKKSSGADEWNINDTTRNLFNPLDKNLLANTSATESDHDRFDALSNGFKMRTDSGQYNGSGATYIYMAFAEAPLVGSNNVPCTAR